VSEDAIVGVGVEKLIVVLQALPAPQGVFVFAIKLLFGDVDKALI